MTMFNDCSPRFLMCRPEHFAVSYTINPWMNPKRWARDAGAHVAAEREWAALHRKLVELGAAIELVPSVPGLPDLVFTANAAVVLDRQALLARFRHPERQREEAHFESAFRSLQARGHIDAVRKLPEGLVLEGAGDCVWDERRNLFWMGYGPRSNAAAARAVEDTFGSEVMALELADERFYHMDTALAPLPGGEVMYLPSAFTAAGQAAIRERVAPQARIEIAMEDGRRFAANAVGVGGTLIMSGCGRRLRAELNERGYDVVTTPLTSFLRSGGSAFCLTLRLDRRSFPLAAVAQDAAVA
jgi:N-dimethylarginine dimethylaminohydrolase